MVMWIFLFLSRFPVSLFPQMAVGYIKRRIFGSRNKGAIYLMVLLVRRRIHWGMGRFWRWALASFCLVRKVLLLCAENDGLKFGFSIFRGLTGKGDGDDGESIFRERREQGGNIPASWRVDRDGELVGWTDEVIDLRVWMVCVRQGLASLRLGQVMWN